MRAFAQAMELMRGPGSASATYEIATAFSSPSIFPIQALPDIQDICEQQTSAGTVRLRDVFAIQPSWRLTILWQTTCPMVLRHHFLRGS